jgi:hypothetical protein
MSKKTNVRVKVKSSDQGHLIGQEFDAQRREESGYINYTVLNSSPPIHLKEEDVTEV